MNLLVKFLTFAAAFAAAESASQGASEPPILMVANRSSHEITFVDIVRGAVVDRISTGEGPHLLSNVSDGLVLATGYGEFPQPHEAPVSKRPPFVSNPNSRATLIDVVKRTVVRDFHLEDCTKPHASWIVAKRAYVTCETERHLLVLDVESGSVVDYVDTQQQGSHVLAFDAESSKVVVSNTGSGSVTLFHIESGDTETLELAAGSEGLLAKSGKVWVSNALDGSISVVDPTTANVAAHIESVCSFPIAFSARLQKHMWVACFASAELVAIDQNTFTVERRVKLGDQPLNLLLHPDRELAYVSLPRKNAIAEIDLKTGEELRRITVGIEPDGLRWSGY